MNVVEILCEICLITAVIVVAVWQGVLWVTTGLANADRRRREKLAPDRIGPAWEETGPELTRVKLHEGVRYRYIDRDYLAIRLRRDIRNSMCMIVVILIFAADKFQQPIKHGIEELILHRVLGFAAIILLAKYVFAICSANEQLKRAAHRFYLDGEKLIVETQRGECTLKSQSVIRSGTPRTVARYEEIENSFQSCNDVYSDGKRDYRLNPYMLVEEPE